MDSTRLSFRHLKKLVSIERVLEQQGLLGHMRQRGESLVGPCPVHGGDNPNAFVVHRTRNLWRCFTGCQAGGDVVELVRRLLSLSYRDTAHYLARLADGLAPVSAPTRGEQQPRRFRPFRRRLELDCHAPLLRAKGIQPETARRFEAGAYHGPGFLEGCVGLRLHDPHGRPLGYAGRRLDPHEATRFGKWKFPRGLPKGELLYGLHRLGQPSPGVVLVECPWGVMRLAQLGIPALGLLGVHLSSHQLSLLAKMHRVLLMLDGDDAGRRATHRLRQQLLPRQVALVSLPDGLDPDDLSDAQLERRCRGLLSF